MNIYLEVRVGPNVLPPFEVDVEGLGALSQAVFTVKSPGVYTYSSVLTRLCNPILVDLIIQGQGGTVQPPCAACLVSFSAPPTDASFVKPPLIAKVLSGETQGSDSYEYPTDGSPSPGLISGIV